MPCVQDVVATRDRSTHFQRYFSKAGLTPGLQFETGTLVGPWSDPKSEFSGTESPDPDPRESQKCLLGKGSAMPRIILGIPRQCGRV